MVPFAVLMIALILVPAQSPAQSARGRTTRLTVILEQPRGDSVVIVTVPQGTELELIERRGDWYRVLTTLGERRISGWLNRIAIEPLTGAAPIPRPAPAPEAPRSAPRPAPEPPRVVPPSEAAPQSASEPAPRRERARSTVSAPKGYIAINGMYQVSSNDFQDSATLTQNAEDGMLTTAYKVKGGPAYDIAGGVAVWRHLALGATVSQYSRSTGATLTAAIPHPFFFNRPRSVDGTVGGLSRKELGVHIQARGLLPLTDRLQVMVFGGPSYFQVTQGFATDVTYSESYPYDSASFQGAVTATAKRWKIGFNAGADVAFFFSRQVGVGFAAQFAQSTVDLPSALGGTTKVKAGGLQAGGGLRVRF